MSMDMFSDDKQMNRYIQRLSHLESSVCNLEKYINHPLEDDLSRAGFV